MEDTKDQVAECAVFKRLWLWFRITVSGFNEKIQYFKIIEMEKSKCNIILPQNV